MLIRFRTICFALAAWAVACATPTSAAPVFDPAAFDTTCSPCRDFDQYANGGWRRSATIPGSYASYGAFQELADRNQETLRAILEAARADRAAKPGSDEARLGDYYTSCMDSAAAERAGLAPVQPLLAAIDAMKDRGELAEEVAWLHAHGVRGAVFMFGGGQDIRNSDRVIASAGQGGLGLPERDYYFRPDPASAEVRAKYLAHVAATLALAGRPQAEAKAAAERIFAIETALAKASLTAVQRRNPEANYHFLPLDSLAAMTPSFAWTAYLERRGLRIDSLNVAQPGFFRELGATITATPLSDWQDYLRWRVLEDAAPMLTQAFAEEDFRWNSVLSGTKEMQPRWKRCLRAADADLGDLLGKAFVKKQFPPAARARALHMVQNLEAALDERIGELDWMGEATKRAARAKLKAFGNKIGYPDKWRTYDGVKIGRTSYFANHLACRTAETARLTAQIGKPTDRGEWRMTAPTVNAFYSPTLNTINFPAGILQPPFYDDAWDDAVNYGAIGAVIGHEMSHGFDDQGRKFDAAGNLRDWWTAEDLAHYQARSQKVEAQYSEYTVLDSLHVNGRLTLGENTADIGGLAIAFAALQRELKRQPAPARIEGFTPEQRFFLAYARIWRRLDRDEALRRQVLTNPHSPAHWRVNGPLSDLDEFAKAFGCKEGDAMVREAAKRARIW